MTLRSCAAGVLSLLLLVRPADAPAARRVAEPQGRLTPSSLARLAADMARDVHARINTERTRRGLAPLRWDDATAAVAAAHSGDMAARDYFAHVDLFGRTASDRTSGLVTGCRGWGTAENIWMARDSTRRHRGAAERAVAGWMASTGHRNNILRARYDTTGVGVAVAGDRVYVTQNFWWCGGP